MAKIFNLTQHTATQTQVDQGVVEPSDKEAVQALLTIEELPERSELSDRATKLAEIVKESGCEFAMIGGAPYFMPILAQELKVKGIKSLYSFSQRRSIDKHVDGKVVKSQVFEHIGFFDGTPTDYYDGYNGGTFVF
ncbi:MAG: hypothetical protein OXR68_04350 [Alphaproteobacteria bacterium]|nr:hypothetical protein [Alphaproteobacteria bacterium]